jgi:hypothetical protein
MTLAGPAATAAPSPPPASARPLSVIVLRAIGPGYGVTSQGPLDPTTFASNAPDPAAARRALATLGRTVDTYERVWLDGSHANAVRDLLVRFSSPATARNFLRAAQHSLDSGEIVSDGPLRSVPGADRTTYFGTTSEPGVGEDISMRAGVYVALLSFFSAASGNPRPIAPGDAAQVAGAQQSAMAAAPGGADPRSRGMTLSSLGWAALAVAVLVAAVATPLVLRRRRDRGQATT